MSGETTLEVDARTKEVQRKIREDHDYIFHDDERYQRAAREAEERG